MQNTRYAFRIIIDLELSRQIFVKCTNINSHANPSSWSLVIASGQK